MRHAAPSVGKINLIPKCMPSLGTADWGICSLIGTSLSDWHCEFKSISRGTATTGLVTPFYSREAENHLKRTTLQAPLRHLLLHAGWGCILLPRSSTGILLRSSLSRSRVYLRPFRG